MTDHCEHCGLTCGEDELNQCAASVAWAPTYHCLNCEADCGPCRDEAARDWQEEHGPRSRI